MKDTKDTRKAEWVLEQKESKHWRERSILELKSVWAGHDSGVVCLAAGVWARLGNRARI